MKTIFLAMATLVWAGFARADETYSQPFQSLQGTWIAQLADASGNLQLFEIGTYHPDGSYSGANVNRLHTEHKGVWVRTGNRKFLLTIMFFTFDEKNQLTGTVKARVRITLAEDLKSYDSVSERIVMDPGGTVVAVTQGLRGRSVRMDVEEPSLPE